jgi:hypothetical protein
MAYRLIKARKDAASAGLLQLSEVTSKDRNILKPVREAMAAWYCTAKISVYE